MILTWLGALAIGLSLGLLGSGGSIVTVPVLVYLVGQGEKNAIAASTRADLAELGVASDAGLVPTEIYSLSAVATPGGFLVMVIGAFLVGFGARYAGGCTSGHGITGLASLQRASLVAILGFFAGGLIATHVILPLVLGG